MGPRILHVLVWDENDPHIPAQVYPRSIRGAVADALREGGPSHLEVRTTHIDLPFQGVDEDKLAEADVLVWWGHERHAEITDDTAVRIAERVESDGMGFVALHSSHYSKPLRRILDTTGHLRGGWSEILEAEEIRVCAPAHPVAEGIQDFVLRGEEVYGAPFEVPPPECVVFQSFFPATNVYFPSGLAWSVGKGSDTKGPVTPDGQGEGIGRVFYFRPGHETVPTYFDPSVRRILVNAVLWAGHSR